MVKQSENPGKAVISGIQIDGGLEREQRNKQFPAKRSGRGKATTASAESWWEKAEQRADAHQHCEEHEHRHYKGE